MENPQSVKYMYGMHLEKLVVASGYQLAFVTTMTICLQKVCKDPPRSFVEITPEAAEVLFDLKRMSLKVLLCLFRNI